MDFDCKRRRAPGTFANPAEIKCAEEKFEESFNLSSMGMFNLLQNETEQISQLAALSEALFEYHSQCASILESLTSRLIEQKEAAAKKPVAEFQPRKLSEVVKLYSSVDDMTPIQQPMKMAGHPVPPSNGATFYSSSSVTTNNSQNSSTTAHLINGT